MIRNPAKTAPLIVFFLVTVLAPVMAAACGGDGAPPLPETVTIEPLTPRIASPSAIPTGGKPAAPSATPTPAEEVRPPADTPAIETPVAEATLAASAPPVAAPSAPASGRWIEVDVTSFVVRLMDGETVVREIGPVGVGVQVDTGAYLSTQTGLFHVYSKSEPLVYDAPYDTYISHWVGFDTAKDNGFHSFLKDAAGVVVDASTGRVSNGCIRTGDAEAIFAFAEIGMPVWVHA